MNRNSKMGNQQLGALAPAFSLREAEAGRSLCFPVYTVSYWASKAT